MIRRNFVRRLLWVVTVSAIGVSGCGSGGKPLTGSQLAGKIIPAPQNFLVDSTGGASGQMSPEQFTQFGGYEPAPKAGFVAGFRQVYSDSGTEEAILITVLEFHSRSQASDYFKSTAYHTLSAAEPTYRPLQGLAGAIEASGTKPFGGNYVHGMSDATGNYYFQVVYQDPHSSEVPVEFPSWADAEWYLLQPGVKLPPHSATTASKQPSTGS